MELYGGLLIYGLYGRHQPIEIIEKNGVRSLHLGTINKQSAMDIYNPFNLAMEFSRVMMLALLFHSAPQRVLLLGLGGGSMAKFLWKYFPKCHVDAIDNDPDVASISYSYFDLPKSKRIKIHIADAIEFVDQSPSSTYDFVFIDLFIGSGMPSCVSTEGFFRNCHRILKPGGLLSWNTWASASEEMMHKSIQDLCKGFSRDMLILPTAEGGNNIFLAFKQPFRYYSLTRLQKNAQRLKKKTNLDFPSLMIEKDNFKGSFLS